MHNRNPFSWERFHQAPIVGIIRGLERETLWKIIRPYREAGFYTLEITMNTAHATDLLSDLVKEFPDLNIGAGTVCTLEDLDLALRSGAQFIVTPITNEAVIQQCVSYNIPIFPGAFTPTEIYKAYDLGASAVKIFPATQLGPQFLRDVLAPLNGIKLLPTGGVSIGNVRSFFEAGAFGVGMGSSLFDKALVNAQDTAGLQAHFTAVKSEIERFLKT